MEVGGRIGGSEISWELRSEISGEVRSEVVFKLNSSSHNSRFVIVIRMYCLFGVNYFFMLGLGIEASKPSRNDLKSCHRHRNGLSV